MIQIFDTSRVEVWMMRYTGNKEYRYIGNGTDSLQLQSETIYNGEGYWQYDYGKHTATQYYFHRDHLGNVCAVWNATKDRVVQRMGYYASGVPMAISTGQGVQQKKYNGKEFISTLGYNRYDYGFRHYDAVIGRFNTCDPMAEMTPWQSPYVYVDNNPINRTDAMGLMGT